MYHLNITVTSDELQPTDLQFGDVYEIHVYAVNTSNTGSGWTIGAQSKMFNVWYNKLSVNDVVSWLKDQCCIWIKEVGGISS